MMRIVFPLRRLKGMPDDEFYGYWREVHGPLVASVANDLGIRRYVQTHTLRDDPITQTLREVYGSSDDLFDGMAEVWFNDPEDKNGPAFTEAGQAAGALLLEDEKKFIDMDRSLMYMGTDIPQINPPSNTMVAGPETPILKFVSYLWQRPDVSFEATQLHWRMNHGPLVRQAAETLGFQRYIQVHRYNTELAEMLRAARGIPDAPVFGHAEIWFNRYEFNACAGPELDATFARALEEVPMFIDLPKSNFFVAKEHVLVDRPVVTDPIPGPPDI
jgi:hypothetical protein